MATPADPVATAPGSELVDPLDWIWRPLLVVLRSQNRER